MKTNLSNVSNFINSITVGDVVVAIIFIAVFLGLGYLIKEFLTKETPKMPFKSQKQAVKL